MTTELPLIPPTLTAAVSASGVATTNPVGPTYAGESWKVQRYSVSLSTGFGTCKVYKNSVSPASLIDSTEDGHLATSENNSVELMLGETIIFQWTAATTGAIGTVNMSGTRSLKGSRGY